MSDEPGNGRPPVGYPPDTVLTMDQCAEALGISRDQILHRGLPVSYALGERTPRLVWADVIAFIRKGAAV